MQTSMLRKSFAGQQVAAAPVQVGILLVRSCRCVLASIPHCRPVGQSGPVIHLPSHGSNFRFGRGPQWRGGSCRYFTYCCTFPLGRRSFAGFAPVSSDVCGPDAI